MKDAQTSLQSFDVSVLQVRQLQEDAVRLQSAYAGDKADDIQKREGEVSFMWGSRTTSGLSSDQSEPRPPVTVRSDLQACCCCCTNTALFLCTRSRVELHCRVRLHIQTGTTQRKLVDIRTRYRKWSKYWELGFPALVASRVQNLLIWEENGLTETRARSRAQES